MEDLGDILKRLGTSRSTPNGDTPYPVEAQESGGAEACEICTGRGWYTPDLPVGHPNFGRIVTCDCQQERVIGERSTRLLRYSNLGHLQRFTFESLERQGRADDPESKRLFGEAFQAAWDYSDYPKGWLVFAGANGSGKTHLAAALANRLIQKGQVVFFVHVPDLLDHLRATFAPTTEISYSDLFDQVRNAPILILDGITNHYTTSWAREKLYQIINYRFSAMLPTVITTAFVVSELDPYIYSRLTDKSVSLVLNVRATGYDLVHKLGQVEPRLLERMRFESFDLRGNNPTASQRATLEAAFRFAKNYASDPDGWLTLFGDTGVGKTHLAISIAVEQLKTGTQVFYIKMPDLLDYLRTSFAPSSPTAYDVRFSEIRNASLLILDNLGQYHSTPWAEEKLFQIIDHRHDARLPTVITTTTDYTAERGPTASRITDASIGALIRMEAPDYRDKNGGGSQGANRSKGSSR